MLPVLPSKVVSDFASDHVRIFVDENAETVKNDDEVIQFSCDAEKRMKPGSVANDCQRTVAVTVWETSDGANDWRIHVEVIALRERRRNVGNDCERSGVLESASSRLANDYETFDVWMEAICWRRDVVVEAGNDLRIQPDSTLPEVLHGELAFHALFRVLGRK
mmetsp:Transcript_13394/g.34161  ORF Transcript_13394/g.34161 Transcript_13394/m.34161 type:complete len:163 (+) Transcript_13394:1064-1552(+)